jgi:SOS-response transcriptional repressor LexA
LVSVVFGHNSELPGGRSPFWIKDAALADLGLQVGDVVAVDLRAVPKEGDLVVVELELDGDSVRTVRRYEVNDELVTLSGANAAVEDLTLPRDQVFVVGVVTSRVSYEAAGGERTRIVESPIE